MMICLIFPNFFSSEVWCFFLQLLTKLKYLSQPICRILLLSRCSFVTRMQCVLWTWLGGKATLQARIPLLRRGQAAGGSYGESGIKANRGCLEAQKWDILQETRRSSEIFLEDTDPWCKSWKMRRQCGIGSISDAGQEGGDNQKCMLLRETGSTVWVWAQPEVRPEVWAGSRPAEKTVDTTEGC